ncbi:UBN2 domain-containing protein [Tanacetum coccineum]
MAAPTIHVSAEENLGDPINIRVDIIHPEPIAVVVFPAVAIVRTQAQHKEAIRGIHEHLLGVPIQEELMALRFRVDIRVPTSGPRGLQETQGAHDQSVRIALIDILLHDLCFFFFKFDTSKGLEDVLENGSWMIRNNPIILNKWTMHTRPLKEELTRIPVWVKIHDVPLQVFFEDGATLLDMMVNKRKNGKTGTSSNSNNRNGVKIDGHSGKLNVKYVPKAAEDENVFDKSINLLRSAKTMASSSNYMVCAGIPNEIYNSVDACQNARAMWNLVKRLMQGTDLSKQERHSKLMNEFDKFSAKPGESLTSVYEIFTTLMNYMERNKLLPGPIAAARNHHPLALDANSYASPLYYQPSQSFYVTHPPLVHDYDDDYQGEVQGDAQEDKLLASNY